MSAQPQASHKLHIRKYPNRRYYDTTRKRHITLEEIHGLIREGYDVEVTDSRSGKDITGKVLAHIILELDPPKLDVFPVPLLHKLLRSSERLVTDFVQKYFNEALESFLDSQQNMEQMMRGAMGLPSNTSPLTEWNKMMWSSVKHAPWGGPGSTGESASAAASTPGTEAEELRGEIRKLQQEVARLRRTKKGASKNRRTPK